MSEAELATVSGFSILREGFGNVVWEGAVDVRGVDLDAVVNIGKNDIAVYEQQELEGTKPPQGSKLNRSAILTIPHVLPKGGDAEAVSKFTNKLKKTTAKLGAEFISYDSSLGELAQVPGVGKSIASEIVNYRKAFGGFKALDEIEKLKGVGKKTAEKIKLIR